MILLMLALMMEHRLLIMVLYKFKGKIEYVTIERKK